MSVELCRLCGKDGVTNVFDDNDLWRKIFVCFGVEIKTNDPITQKICKSCYFFTNSVYEFRLSSIEYDNKLKKDYASTHTKVDPELTVPIPISYPSEISQDAFLNTLNLANKNDIVYVKTPVYHPSVLNLKRKWPNLQIPNECFDLNLDPTVFLGVSSKFLKLSAPKMGIWSIKNKQTRGKQPDLVLTRVRRDNSSEESLNDSASDKSDKYKVKFNFRIKNKAESDSPQQSTSLRTTASKKKRKKYPDWCSSGKKKGRISPLKRTSSEKLKKMAKVPQNIPKHHTSPTKSEESSISISPPRNNEKDRITLKNLLETDVHFDDILPRQPGSDRQNTSESPGPRIEEYGNLLVAAGEEVQTFICQTCSKIFDTLGLLNNHKKYSHKSSLRCTKCSKRFAIVESLVKHNLTYHPETVGDANEETKDNLETVADVNNTATKDNHPTVIRNTVARKRTNGTIEPNRSSFSTPTPPELLEYIISDDDDVEITDVIENTTTDPNTDKESTFDNIINAALEPQKSSNTEENNKNCPLLYDALVPQLVIADCKQKEKVEPKNPQELEPKVTNPDDVFLIDDSDDEIEDQSAKNLTTNKENDKDSEEQSFLILDDSNSSRDTVFNSLLEEKSSNKSEQSMDSTSSAPSTSTDVENNKTDSNVSQKIVVVPSAEDKAHMDATSSIKAKITNEISYINYIFNKCSYNYIKSNQKQPKNVQKKWFLKDIQKFTEKTVLPIKLDRVVTEDVSVEYAPVTPEKYAEKLAFWNTLNSIDVKKKITIRVEPAIDLPAPPKTNILKVSSSVSHAPAKKTEEKQRNIPKSISSTVSLSKTTDVQTPAIIQSEVRVSSASPVAKICSIPTSTPLTFVKTNSVQNTSSNIVSNTMYLLATSSQQMSTAGGNLQVMCSSPSATIPTNQISRTANVLLPSVAVPPVLQNVQSPSNIDIQTTQKLLNYALQNGAVSFVQQQKNQVKSYSKTQPFSPLTPNHKSVLPVTPNSLNEIKKDSPEQQESTNGYILLGVSTNQLPSNENGPVDESNNVQKQPIVLNGMSYPSFAKIRNLNQPTFVVQQLGQQTNVNIQNCINICQQEVATNTGTATVPYIIQEQQPNNMTAPIVSLSQLQPMTSVIQSMPAIGQSAETITSKSTSDATVSTTRPTIRIKNLSELRGDNLNSNQRNELHNLYSNTVSNYVQNYSNTPVTNPSANDEYLQIS